MNFKIPDFPLGALFGTIMILIGFGFLYPQPTLMWCWLFIVSLGVIVWAVGTGATNSVSETANPSNADRLYQYAQDRLLVALKTTWPIVLTIVISILLTFMYFFILPYHLNIIPLSEGELTYLEHIGAYIGGYSSVVTLLLLLSTFWMQLKELSLQRHELTRQRTAYETSSAATRANSIKLLLPTYERRLNDQCEALLDALDVRAPNEQAMVEFLYSLYDLNTKISSSPDDTYPLCCAHLDSYINIYDEFVTLAEETLTRPWMVGHFLPTDNSYRELYDKLKKMRPLLPPLQITPREEL